MTRRHFRDEIQEYMGNILDDVSVELTALWRSVKDYDEEDFGRERIAEELERILDSLI